MKAQQQIFPMTTVFKAIDELRHIRGEDAAMEFSSILSHYHLNGANDTSYLQSKQDDSFIPKDTKSKKNRNDTDSLTQLLNSMSNGKQNERKPILI